MYYKKANTDASSDDTLQTFTGANNCCEGNAASENCYTVAADATLNLSTDDVVGVTIDGTLYTFATPATTAALLKTGLDAAFVAAGYLDIKAEGIHPVTGSTAGGPANNGTVGVETSGAATAVAVYVCSTTELTITLDADTDVPLVNVSTITS